MSERTPIADRLALALDRYMAAVVAYNGNPWDRVNVRKYAEAKARAEVVLREYRGERAE